MTGMFSQPDGGWHPLAWFGGSGGHGALEEATSRSSQQSSSPIKRVSMAVLLQQLAEASITKNRPAMNNEIIPDKVLVQASSNESTTESSSSTSTTAAKPLKNSPIRRVWIPAGTVVYSLNDNSTTPSVIISVNPHLRQNITTTSTTTTTEPPTTTTAASPERPFKSLPPTIISKTKSGALKTSADSPKLAKKRPNSPIYYIKLPATSFVPVAKGASKQTAKLPIFIATTTRPTEPTVTTTTEPSTTTTEPSTIASEVTSPTLKPARTNSRIINIKGPFVFNGKPGGIYSERSPYRAPNYLEILNDLYPKLKRAQFIRRRR